MSVSITPAMSKHLENIGAYHGADEYMLWHRTLNPELLAYDVDIVEWRIIKRPILLSSGNSTVERTLIPVATMELTKITKQAYTHLRDKFLEVIRMRYRAGLQGRTAIYLANKLGVPCFIVAFEEGLEHFSIKEITNDGINIGHWIHMDQQEYTDWLESL